MRSVEGKPCVGEVLKTKNKECNQSALSCHFEVEVYWFVVGGGVD